ncbi:MAG: cbb3-type cytochrome oxidase assembly protein CcoS [Desulfosarcina sp.]|nr:cbb3-type cytochrome oxidase assembly protein CcoS [Desulfobacterales bacterium]
MYYPYFLTYMALGFGITLIIFFWALDNGQFKDQQRARYLPLHEAPDPPPVRPSRFIRLQIITLFTMAALGLAATAAVILFALVHGS